MKYIHFNEIDSTNTYLKNNYVYLEDLSIVTADHQTSGRGRLGRQWIDENNCLMFSILFKNKKGYDNIAITALITAIAIHQVLMEYNIETKIKWPNDLLYNDKKVVGILTESIIQGPNIEALIIGCGINLYRFNQKKDFSTISLNDISDKEISPEELLSKLCNRIIDLITIKDLNIEYLNKYLSIKDKTIDVIIDGKQTEVICKEVLKNGDLLVEHKNLKIAICSGEVSLHNKY